MHFETEAVAGPVDKSDGTVLAVTGFVAGFREAPGHRGMDFASVDAGCNRLERVALGLQHGRHHPALHLARLALEIGTRHVAKIARPHHPREDIDDDEFVRTKRARTALMRITA